MSEKLANAAQSCAQRVLGCATVEPDVECAGKRGDCPKALRQAARVEPVTPGNENTKIVTTHRVGTCEVMDAPRVAGSHLQQGGGQVTDVHRAADVVGVQGSGSTTGRKVVYEAYVLGPDATDDQ